MFKRILSLLLTSALLLSLAACKTQGPEVTTEPTTQPTEPPTTQPPAPTAQEYFDEAMAALEAQAT